MASVMPDLQLPSQPQGITAVNIDKSANEQCKHHRIWTLCWWVSLVFRLKPEFWFIAPFNPKKYPFSAMTLLFE